MSIRHIPINTIALSTHTRSAARLWHVRTNTNTCQQITRQISSLNVLSRPSRSAAVFLDQMLQNADLQLCSLLSDASERRSAAVFLRQTLQNAGSHQKAGFHSLEQAALSVVPHNGGLVDHGQAMADGGSLRQLVAPPNSTALKWLKDTIRHWQHTMQPCLEFSKLCSVYKTCKLCSVYKICSVYISIYTYEAHAFNVCIFEYIQMHASI